MHLQGLQHSPSETLSDNDAPVSSDDSMRPIPQPPTRQAQDLIMLGTLVSPLYGHNRMSSGFSVAQSPGPSALRAHLKMLFCGSKSRAHCLGSLFGNAAWGSTSGGANVSAPSGQQSTVHAVLSDHCFWPQHVSIGGNMSLLGIKPLGMELQLLEHQRQESNGNTCKPVSHAADLWVQRPVRCPPQSHHQ